jgi:hypothetical protein
MAELAEHTTNAVAFALANQVSRRFTLGRQAPSTHIDSDLYKYIYKYYIYKYICCFCLFLRLDPS